MTLSSRETSSAVQVFGGTYPLESVDTKSKMARDIPIANLHVILLRRRGAGGR